MNKKQYQLKMKIWKKIKNKRTFKKIKKTKKTLKDNKSNMNILNKMIKKSNKIKRKSNYNLKENKVS